MVNSKKLVDAIDEVSPKPMSI